MRAPVSYNIHIQDVLLRLKQVCLWCIDYWTIDLQTLEAEG